MRQTTRGNQDGTHLTAHRQGDGGPPILGYRTIWENPLMGDPIYIGGVQRSSSGDDMESTWGIGNFE